MRISGGGLCGVVALACAALALPATAAANDYCVNEPACAGGGGIVEPASASGLQDALSSAGAHANGSEPDEVLIGAGDYSLSAGFTYDGDAVVIRGAGEGSTVLTDGAGKSSTVFSLTTVPDSKPSLSALTIDVPDEAEELTGLYLDGGDVEGVRIEGGSASSGLATGMDIVAGVFSGGQIEFDAAAGTSQAVEAHGGEVLGSTLVGSYGVQASGRAVLRGCRISGNVPFDSYDTAVTIEDSLIDLRGRSGPGVLLASNRGVSSSGTLRGDTIVNGGSGSVGVEVSASDPEGATSEETAAIDDTIVDDVTHAIAQTTDEAGSRASTTTEYSSFEAAGDLSSSENGAAKPAFAELDPVSATPDFVNPVFGEGGFGEGDWRLLASSPLLGAGAPGELLGGEYASDAAGEPRIVDGKRDVGAYEYQRRPPLVTATASQATVDVGQTVEFSSSATEPEPGDSVTSYQWTFSDGASVPAGSGATHAFAKEGAYTATLTATDALGYSASKSVTVLVAGYVSCAASGGGCGGPQIPCGLCGTGPPPCDTAGSCPGLGRTGLSTLSLSPRRLRAARTGASIVRSGHGGALVRFTLFQPARVQFAVQRLLPGFTDGRLCEARRSGRESRRCTRRVAVLGSFAYTASRASVSLRFSGRIGGRTLPAGSYLLLAWTPGGRRLTAPFQIVR